MSFLIYGMIGLMPGDPIDIMIAGNPEATAEDAARLRALYGLDQPIYKRYFSWLTHTIQGDFGYSRLFSQPVTELLWDRICHSFYLMFGSLFLALIIALPLGICAARYQQTKIDHLTNLFCFAGISVPPFWLALMLISVFAVSLGWLPAGGIGDEGEVSLKYYILPILSLTLATIATYTRHIRSATIDIYNQEFIKTAQAKGCSPLRVITHHVLRQIMIPVSTLLALDFGTLFGGAMITETMFALPGMGRMIYDAIMGNDYNLALVSLLFVTFMILFGNLLADLLYSWLDPRIKLKSGEDHE